MHTRRTLGLDDARAAVDAVLLAATAAPDRPIAVTVADADGDVIAFARMDGCMHLSRDMASRKAYTAARMGTDTSALGERMKAGGIDLGELDPRFTRFGGGVCVRIDGVVVGAVAVSGLSADEDEQLAGLGAAAITG